MKFFFLGLWATIVANKYASVCHCDLEHFIAMYAVAHIKRNLLHSTVEIYSITFDR